MKRSLLYSIQILSSRSRSAVLGFAGMLAILGNVGAGRANAQESTRNGVVLGGVTGAVIGGVIGNNHKNQAAEGALIGGAVGAVAGGLLGNHRDQAIAQQRYYEQQRAMRTYPQYSTQSYYPPAVAGQPTIVTTTPVYGTPVYGSPVYSHSHVPGRTVAPSTRTVVRRPVTMTEVINMTRSGVSDTVIASHIQANGVAKQLEVNDVILLSQEGVSDYVITAMQITGSGGTIVQGSPSTTSTVIAPSSPNSSIPGTVIRRDAANTSGVVAPPLLERRGF
jgi:hypothetical protein